MSERPPEILPTENVPEKSNREVINLEIEGKNYEVVKTHFTYPEYIQKENGGVEGYDRFELSWEDFDKVMETMGGKDYVDHESTEQKNHNVLDKISEKLGIGTYDKQNTVSHFFGGVWNKGSKFGDNKFFLAKPFDIKDYIEGIKNNKLSYSGNWVGMENGKEIINLKDLLEEKGISFDNHPDWSESLQWGNITEFMITELFKQDPNNLEILQDTIKDMELIYVGAVAGMSFCQGSHLIAPQGGMYPYTQYDKPFFNFNERNRAFPEYIKNIKSYGAQITGWGSGHDEHPKFSLVFTDDFPALRWCFADTAYVPMKEGPNFFRFYSEDTKEDVL